MSTYLDPTNPVRVYTSVTEYIEVDYLTGCDNPAWLYLWCEAGGGLHYDTLDVNMENIIRWAKFCDEKAES